MKLVLPAWMLLDRKWAWMGGGDARRRRVCQKNRNAQRLLNVVPLTRVHLIPPPHLRLYKQTSSSVTRQKDQTERRMNQRATAVVVLR